MEYGLDVQPDDVYWNAADDQVSEAAVIGAPDQLRGEVIEAFVVLRDPDQARTPWERPPGPGVPGRAPRLAAIPNPNLRLPR